MKPNEKKNIIFLMLEFLGLYTVIFLIIGFFHLSFAKIPENLFGKEIYHTILSEVFFSSLKWW